MKNLAKIALGTLLGAICLPALAAYDDYIDCNVSGLDRMDARDAEKAESVFYNRLGNKGEGNGGEALYVFVSGGVVSDITCIDTYDEDFGGTLATPGGSSENSVYLPEVDPGS
jgi:hypothetical protein